ncbi:MAG TPA: class I SAM-dependent methyltransferase [Patescibacteria group bacterium]|nr:class I SAM-dependent methyltransferase [Patescibacteria group bacterium]
MSTNSYYNNLYEKAGKRIGWDFSHLKTTEEGQGWDFYKEVLKKVKLTDAILDIGTGGGERILKIAKHFKSVYGIDHSPSMVSTAKKNLKKTKLKNVKFLMMDSSKLDFPDNYFDIITDRHCDFNPSEVFRVLKMGGYFFTQQVSEGDQMNIKEAYTRGQGYGTPDGTLKNKYLKQMQKLGFSKIEDFDYNSKIIYKTDKDYIFLLRYTPTIPEFGKKKNDLEILNKFIEENKTKRGIETNSKRFMIVAVK